MKRTGAGIAYLAWWIGGGDVFIIVEADLSQPPEVGKLAAYLIQSGSLNLDRAVGRTKKDAFLRHRAAWCFDVFRRQRL